MSDWSRMGVTVRPDVHARFQAILARAPAAAVVLPPRRRPRPSPRTRLSPPAVAQLRTLRAEGATLDALARQFHVAVSTASRAASGRTW